MRRSLLSVLAVLALAVGVAPAADEVTWSARVEPATARAGEVVQLILTATLADGWHLYAAAQEPGGPVATAFSPAETVPAEALGVLREPEPEAKFDQSFAINVLSHHGTIEFIQPFRVPEDLSGELTLAGAVEYQLCTDRSCLAPTTTDLASVVLVEPGEVRAEYAEPPAETAAAWRELLPEVAEPASEPSGDDVAAQAASTADQARSQGLLVFLGVAFLAGLAALLTPCVFPMIPITVSFFTKQAGGNAGRRVGLASAYGLGIVVMYTGLGLLLAITMGASGAQRIATNPWVNVGFAALFVFFALSLFGYFELQLPGWLVNRMSSQGSGGGYVGALFMGLTLTLAAFTCTVQFVGGVLVWAANGEFLWPILGMLSFSTAFALPFFLLALFPQYLASLPKSGSWLETTKIVLGWIEVGAAFKFLSNADLVWQWTILTREFVLAAWAICALLTTIFLWGKFTIGHAPLPERLGRGRQWWGLMFLLLSVYFLWGLTGAPLGRDLESLLPPREYSRDASRQYGGQVHWYTDYDEALAVARATGTKLFLDFTGVTCTNCRWMEQNVFVRPEIAERLSGFTLVKLYTDTGERMDEYRAMQEERYQTASLPFYAVTTAEEATVATFDGMTRNASEFAAFLDRGR